MLHIFLVAHHASSQLCHLPLKAKFDGPMYLTRACSSMSAVLRIKGGNMSGLAGNITGLIPHAIGVGVVVDW